MKGVSYNLIYTTIGAIIIAGMFALVVTFIMSGIIETKMQETKVSEELKVEAATYLIESCLKQGSDFISASFLDKKKGNSISDICKLDFGARITDKEVENGKWNFKYNEDAKRKYDILIDILYEEEIHIGRLYVSL